MVILEMKIHGTMTISSKSDYLSILGLSSNFDDLELKKAFRREARKWHPDLNKNDINAEERFKLINQAYEFLRDPKKRESLFDDSNSYNSYQSNNFQTGFPYFEDYLDSVFGFESRDIKSESDRDEYFEDEEENNEGEENYDNFDYPATSPYEPPPIKSFEDVETIIDLTPDEALYGASILVELEDRTVVEVDTPPYAGDGWRLRLENVAKGGKDHYLHLRVLTETGLRVDGLRVITSLNYFHQMRF